MPWVPSVPGEVPTLGYLVIDWMTAFLAAPGKPVFEPFVPYREQEEFLLGYYALDPVTGRRKIRRGVISRPRGWGKSPFCAAIACAEALAPVVPAGWDADGQPVGMEWWKRRTPLVQILATSETQVMRNTWEPLLEMLREGPAVDEYPGLEPMETFVSLPHKGRIEPSTSGSSTIKGARAVFQVMDQTEEWTASNGGMKLYQKAKSNAAKTGGSFIESPNAFIPGEGSVAEQTAKFDEMIRLGKPLPQDLLYDHREAPPETDMWERESLVIGLRVAYGDASDHVDGCVIHQPPCPPGHQDLEPLISTVNDPTSDPQISRSDFLNQITNASNQWITAPDWGAVRWGAIVTGDDRPVRAVTAREPIVLGFDGSRERKRGKADATALVACTVTDGHLFPIRVWEQPDNLPEGQTWKVPADEVDATVDETFKMYNVVGFYADPAYWETYVKAWEARYRNKLQIGWKSAPIQWWMTGGRSGLVAQALKAFHDAVISRELSHNGSAILTQHVTNARRTIRSGSLHIAKEHKDSDNKIDAAVAAVLAWRARLDAVGKGIGRARKASPPRRIR